MTTEQIQSSQIQLRASEKALQVDLWWASNNLQGKKTFTVKAEVQYSDPITCKPGIESADMRPRVLESGTLKGTENVQKSTVSGHLVMFHHN